MPEKKLVMIYATCPSMEVARAIAERLVEDRLVACANIWPGMVAIYRWEGQTERATEVVLVLKTTQVNVVKAVEIGTSLHPYETPAFVVLPIEGGSSGYLAWLRSSVRDEDA